MKIVRTWVFYISLLIISKLGYCQEENILINQDSLSIKPKVPLNIRFGIDIYRIILSSATNDFDGFEAVGDIQVSENLFLALELGKVETTKQVEQVNFTTNGSYLKLGFDYNMFENWENMRNQVTLGLRLASSSHSQILNSYSILDRTRFWPSSSSLITNGFSTGERFNLNAQWFEVVFGFKVQLIKNIYTGLSFRLNRLVKDKIPSNFDNIYIPGFNRKTEDNIFGAGFNYTLTYSIPISSKTR
tara:strand:- start:257 stop:991 length:735 start_codon:yes stop_codon:yes gene_type:complete